MYTEPRKYEEVYRSILDLIQGRRLPETNLDRSMATALESSKSFLYIEFEKNSKAQGSLVGLGKEPDVPYSNQALELRNIGEQHRNIVRLLPVSLFICSEDYDLNKKKYFLHLSGAKVFGKLVIPPKVETHTMDIKRDAKKMIISVGLEYTNTTLLDHEGWMKAYLGF